MAMEHPTHLISELPENGLKKMEQIGGLMMALNGPIQTEMDMVTTHQMVQPSLTNSQQTLQLQMIPITTAIQTIGLH